MIESKLLLRVTLNSSHAWLECGDIVGLSPRSMHEFKVSFRNSPIPPNDDSMNSTIFDESFQHPLIGTWTFEDSTSVEYTITALGESPMVTGVDVEDGEKMVISNLSWDGVELRFKSVIPSNGYKLLHIFRSVAQDTAEHEWTCVEQWKKKP